jgi:threonine/homoserine/homoserine lactone efflux protein
MRKASGSDHPDLELLVVNDIFPPLPTLSAFVVASLVLAITPGPSVFYIVSRSLVHGRRSGMLSVLGTAVGSLGNALAASLGLAALFAVSSLAFAVVKYAGAAYLIYMGARMLFSRPDSDTPGGPAAAPAGHVFRDAMVVSLLNPKTTIFFAAFLPQFVTAQASPMRQSLLLGLVFVLLAAVTDSIYAMTAGSMSRVLARGGAGRIGKRLGGGLFIGLGIFTALSGSRGSAAPATK